MPELPEVETVVRKLRPLLIGRVFQQIVDVSPLMVSDVRFSKRLESASVQAVDRHGKWIFIRLSTDETLVVHLGMSGRVGVTSFSQQIDPHTHLRCVLDSGDEFRFVDPRRFGELLLMDLETFNERFGVDRLGPDALVITKLQLSQRLARSRRVVKATLLDQRVLAGVGNIYADEILHAAGISPLERACNLTQEAVVAIHAAMRRTLAAAIRSEGSTVYTFAGLDGAAGTFQNKLKVYGRAGKPCTLCGFEIQCHKEVVPGRSTYWCPPCQTSKRDGGGGRAGKNARGKSGNVLPHR